MTDRPPQRSTTLGEALIELVDLIAFSANSNAARRRFESATRISLGRMALALLDSLTVGPATVSDLAAALEVDMTRASRQIAAMVRIGLVVKTRESFPGDRRQVRIALTDRGIDAMNRWGDSWREQVRRPLELWVEADIDDFEKLLNTFGRRLAPYATVRIRPENDCEPSAGAKIPHLEPESRSTLERCLENVVTLVRLIGSTHFDAALESAGVHLNELEYLLLRDVEKMGPTTVGNITTRLDVPQAVVSRAVRTVRTMGLIYGEAGPDRRRMWLHLTVDGMKTANLITQSRLRDLEELFSDLTPEDRERYTELTNAYVEQLLSIADPAASRYL
ncbi:MULTISPECIES: MarR family transcriptional regulator [Nocardiaceae]|uniref:MarR family transcriptional regulator n=1 Tax=Nocardiaceae TaxID=85025 RepID=UPI0015C65A7E|nr:MULTISPECIES: MarR family transcriptional regulator [Rhodococcus]